MTLTTLRSTLTETFSKWNEHEAPRLGAALAFYTILSLAPLVVIVTALAALAFDRTLAQDALIGQVKGMVGEQGAAAMKTMMASAQKPASGVLASVAGVLTLLFGASGVFGELREALDKIWEVKTNTSAGLWGMVRQRFFSFGMVLAIGFLLLVSLFVSAALAALGKFFGGILPMPEVVLTVLNFLVSFAGITICFALIFKYVPGTRIEWREVRTGATVTALLFTIGKSVIGLYLGKAAVGSAYGAAGSVVVMIVWVYYSAMIFFFGAEFTHVMARGDAGNSPARV